MKVFYVTSTEFYKKFPEKFKETVKLLEELSRDKVLTYTEQQSKDFDFEKDQEEIRKMIKEIEKSMKEADVLIADITISTAGPGYDIATALNLKKPVLVLKREDDNVKRGPHSITVKKSKLLNYIKYNDENIRKVLRDFLNNSRKLLDTKFILIISPEIDRYLEWAADNKRMHKAQIVREAVEDMMVKDQEFKKAIKDED